jgi:hemoglobin-like flavoprotein
MQNCIPKDIFLSSLKRCQQFDNFISVFYERFLASSEDVRRKFIYTDFEKQNRMLSQSLELCVEAITNNPLGLRELTERAESHNRNNLDIKPELYDLWLKALITVASEFDAEWTDTIEEAWRQMLGYAIKHMIKHY